MTDSYVLKYILDFDEKPATEKLQTVKDDVTSVKESVKALSEQKIDTESGNVSAYGLDNKSTILDSFDQTTSVIDRYSSSLKKMGAGLREVLMSPFSLLSSQVIQLDSIMTQFSKKHLKPQDFVKYNNQAAAQAAALMDSTAYAETAISRAMSNPILKNKKMDSSLPFLRNLATRLIEEDTAMNRSAMSLGSAASFVSGTKQFREAIKNISGYETVDSNIYREAAEALLASSPQARSRFLDTRGHLSQFRFDKKRVYSTNYDALPENMRDVYVSKGLVEGKTPRGHKVHANDAVYQALINLTDYGENHELVEMARSVGLMQIGSSANRKSKSGQMHWRQSATMDQMDTLAGLTLQRLHEARYGSPLYPRNPLDNASHSKRIMELNQILDVLQQEEQLQPGILPAEQISHFGGFVQRNKNTDRSIIRSFANPSLYVIPQTRVDAKGQLVFSDPRTAERTAERTKQGLGDKDDDSFVAINDSLFARLAGFSPKDNNTYGYGVDSSGQAVYGKPNILKINASNLVPHDRFGMPIQRKKGEPVKPTDELLAYTEIMRSGGYYGENGQEEKYVFAWPAAQGKGAYLMPETRVKAIKEHFEKDLNMPSPLEGFDSRGVIIPGNRERTSKLLNNLRKGASPGTPLIERGFRLPSIQTIDYEAIDSLFGASGLGQVLKNEIIDGLAYGSPDYIPTSLQGRLWGPSGKFMLQRLGLADLFGKSGAFDNLAYDGETNLNQLITKSNNKYGYSVWVPSLATRNINKRKDLLQRYGVKNTEEMLMNLKAGKYDETTAEEIRQNWLTDVMSNPDIMMTDSSVKNEDKFIVLPEDMYRGKFKIPQHVKIDPTRLDEYGRVLLNAREAEQYMYDASAATYGLWAMKTNDDFETSKDTLAVSAADAINYPPSLIRMSDKLYKAKLERYADKAWLREHFLSQPQFADKVESNPNWIESQEARAIIQSEKNAIEADRDSRQKYLITTKNKDVLAQMLPGAGNDRLIKAVGGGEVSADSKVAQLFPELYTLENLEKWGFDTTQLKDEVGSARPEFFIEKNGRKILDPTKFMYAPGWNHSTAIAGRMPASPGTYAELINLAYQREKDNNKNAFMKAFHAVGNFDTEMAAVTPEGIQRMNTGDFDGDTIWLYARMADDMASNLEAVNAPMDKAKAAAAKFREAHDKLVVKGKLPNIYEKYYGNLAKEDDVGQIRAATTLNAQGAQLIMGQATAGIRNILTYGDLNDEDTSRALQALVEYYDLGTSEVMNMGLEPEVQNDLAKKYMMSHRTYNRMMQQIVQEESSGEPKIDSIFKYRPGSLSSPRDLATMEMQSSSRRSYGSDLGLRERVLKAVDRAYKPGSKLHSVADQVANLIVDTETGYRFWTQEEVEKLSALIPDVKMETVGDAEREGEPARIESFIQDFITNGPTLERMQSLASKDTALGKQAQFLLEHQGTDQEKAVREQQIKMLDERRKAAIDVEQLQHQIESQNNLSVENLIKLGKIQDTTKLDKFQTSWSVTSVEPFMDGDRTKARLMPYLKNARSYDLRNPADPFYNGKVYTGLSALKDADKLEFGSYSSIAQKEMEELLNQGSDSIDTVLGTFMHAGFEKFFTKNAEAIAKGGFSERSINGFTEGLRKMLEEPIQGGGSWRKEFDKVNVNIDDIIAGFNNVDATGAAAFGPSVQALKNYQQIRSKLENIFGIEYGLDTSTGKSTMQLTEGMPERLLRSYFNKYEQDPALRMKRVVATENNIFDKNGQVTDVSKFADAIPLGLDPVFGERYVHAKPDLVYEGEDGKYHIMDYKSSSKGAVQALYQNAIYANMLTKLGKASYEGFFEDGREVPESLKKNLEVYRQFVEPYQDVDDNAPKYRSKISTLQSFDLGTGRKNVVQIDENGIQAVYEEYLNGVQKKASELKKGYIAGKQLLVDRGLLDSFAANPEKVIEENLEIQQRAKDFTGDENAAVRQFLTGQFEREQQELANAQSTLFKYKKDYGMIGESYSINKFSALERLVNGGLSKDAMAAMYAQYGDNPEIQRIIADQIEGKHTAKNDLEAIMRNAAIQDSGTAIDKLQSMVYGKDTNSKAMSLTDAINREAALARGSLLALKDKDSWDFQNNKWRDEDETIDLSKLKQETDKEKEIYAAAVEFNKKESDRLTKAQLNKEAYKIGELNLKNLEAKIPELKEKAFSNEIKSEQVDLDKMLGDNDPYKSIANAINEREVELQEYILAKKLKMEKLQAKLDQKYDNGTNVISDTTERNSIQNLINQLQSGIAQTEAKLNNADQEVVQKQMERLGLDAKSPQQKASEWLKTRMSVIRANGLAQQSAVIKEFETNERQREEARVEQMSKDDQSQAYYDLIRQNETERKNDISVRNARLNEITKHTTSQLATYRNLGKDLETELLDQDRLSKIKADSLVNGQSFTSQDRAAQLAVRRFEEVLKIGQTLPESEQSQFWQNHRYQDILSQAEKEIGEQQEAQLPALFAKAASYNARANRLNGLPMPETASGGLISYITPAERQQMFQEEIARLEEITPAPVIPSISEEEKQRRINERYNELAKDVLPQAHTIEELQEKYDNIQIPEITSGRRKAVSQERYQQQQQRREEERAQRAENRTRQSFEDAKYIASNIGYDPRTQDDFDKTLALRDAIANVSFEDYQKYLQTEKAPKNLEAAMDAIKLAQTNESLYQQRGESYLDHKDAFKRITWDMRNNLDSIISDYSGPLDSPKLDKRFRREFSRKDFKQAKQLLDSRVDENGNSYLPATVADLANSGLLYEAAGYSTLPEVAALHGSTGKRRNAIVSAATQLGDLGLLDKEIASRVQELTAHDLETNNQGKLHGFMDSEGRLFGYEKRHKDAIAKADSIYQYRLESIDAQYGRKQREEISQVEQDWAQKEAEFDERERVAAKKTQNKKRKRSESSVISQEQANIRAERLAAEEEKNLQIQQINDRYEGSEERLTAIREAEKERNEAVEKANSDYKATRSILRQNGLLKRTYTRGSLTGTFKRAEEEPAEQEDKRFKLHADAKELSYKIAQGKTRQIERRDAAIAEQSEAAAAIVQEKKDTETRAKAATAAKTEINAQIAQETAKANQEALRQRKQDIQTQAQANVNNQIMAMQGGIPFGAPSGNPPPSSPSEIPSIPSAPVTGYDQNELNARALAAQQIAQERQVLRQLKENSTKETRSAQEQEIVDAMEKRLSPEGAAAYADRLTQDNLIKQQQQEQLVEEQRAVQLAAMRERNDLALTQSNRNFRKQDRQLNRYAFRGNIARSFFMLQDRREGLTSQQEQLLQQRKELLRTNSLAQERLANYDGDKNGKEYKVLKHEADVAAQNVQNVDAKLGQVGEQMKSLSGPGATASAVFKGLGRSAMQAVGRLGVQVWRKAIQEAKRFIKEYDKCMTEIQMITLKSNEQINTLGTNLIGKASELKVSFTDVSQTATALYRQGLSDAEVNERLDTILKFSKVSGTKAEAATKLVTVATNTGLTESASEAADIVTSLGDSAATNAAEIEKGIEKAGAAAAADGTSFAQLSALLTAITSTTQIGGNVAGRTINTIMARMNKIGTNELIYDENGNAVSGSNVAKLLEAQGVRVYDQKGNKRSTFDVLYDLSKNWDNISDAERSQLSTEIAGTRMYSNFAAIMQGMQEGDIDRYLELADNSKGIVNQKYTAYERSYAASQEALKSGFDHFVKNYFGWTGNVAKGFNNSVGGFFEDIASLTDDGEAKAAKARAARRNSYQAYYTDKYSGTDRLEVLRNKENRTASENEEYYGLIQTLSNRFNIDIDDFSTSLNEINDTANTASGAVDNVSTAFETVAQNADQAAQRILDQVKAKKGKDLRNRIISESNSYAFDINKELTTNREEQFSAKDNIYNPLFEGLYSIGEDGKLTLHENAADTLSKRFSEYARNDVFGGLWGQLAGADVSANQDITPLLSQTLAKIGAKYLNDENSEGLRRLHVRGDISNAADPNYWTKSLNEYIGLPQDTAQELLDYYVLYSSEQSSDSTLKSEAKRTMTDLFGEFYNESEIDYLTEDLVQKIVSNKKYGTDKQGAINDAILSYLPGEDEDAFAITDAVIARYRENLEDSDVFHEIGLPDVGNNGYYINKSNGERVYREDLLNYYRTDYTEQAKNLLLPTTDLNSVVLPNGKKLTDNQIKKIEDIRKGNTQYNYLSAQDQNYLKNLYPAVPNASNYTAVNSYIDNSAFEEKNKVGLAADSLIQALNSQNFTTFDDFYSYYKRSPEISNILDPILSNVLQSAQFVNGKWISQPDTLKQVEDVLYANSYSYGKKQRTASETGNLANYAFNALQYGTGFVTKEDKEAAIQAYKKDLDFDASKNKYDASTDEEIIDLMLQDEGISETRREALTGLKTLMRGRILGETEIEALKSVIGERLYSKARRGEKFEGENLEYIRTKLLNNTTGLTDFTTKQRADNIRRLRTLQAEGNLNTVDEEIVKDELKGWNNADRWYALATKSNRNPEEQIAFENLNEELRQLQENADVEVSIEGISVLEKAGKVAEGTANALKEIAKGGVAAQKAIASIQNSTFSREQYAAMLTEGTLAERTEAIKYYSGWDDKLIEKDRKGAYEAAMLVYNAEQEQLRTTAKALTNSRLLVSDPNSEQALAINQTAKAYGLEWDNKKGEYIVPEILQGLFRSDALAGSSPLFTGTQIAEAQKRLLLPENDANRLTKDNTEEYELYTEAVRQAGEQTKEYFRMLEQNQKALDEEKDVIYTQDQISAQLDKANAEIDLTAKDNADKDILRDLELSGNTFAYSQEQYRQNNKAGLAANEIYRTLSSADVKSVDELMGVLGDKNNAQNWKDLLESSPELTKKLSDMGLSMDENGNWDVSGLIASSDDAASALSALAGIVREASEAYTHEDQKTTGEKYQAAMDYLSGNPLDEAKSYSAMSDIFGQPFAEEVGSAYQAWRPQYDARQTWEADLAEAQKTGNIAEENRLIENEVVDPGAFNPYANMSDYNSELAQTLVQNAQFGQYGLTDVQRYDEMNRLFEQANTMGGIAKLRNQDAFGLYNQFVTGGVEGFEEWTRGIEALNEAGIALGDFNAESEACQKALSKAGIAVNNFADNNKKMAGQLRAAEIETKKLYGENSSDIANRIRQLTGSEKDRAAALKEMTANYDKFNQVTYARNQWNAGKKKYKDIASAIGQSEEWVKNTDKHGDSTEITRLLDVEWEVDNKQVLSDMQAQIDAALTGIDEEKFAEALVKLNVNGEYDISGLQAVAAQADAETAAIINNLIAAISAYNGSVTFGASSDGKTIDIKATNVKAGGKGGGGYSGGGGGGGGGKSEAEKLLEKQKREQSRLQHEYKMLEIQEKHYDRTNEYADYMDLLDEEIAKQRELEGLYANNVAELQSMLAGMSEEDDDFDKVASALYEAQEALADISNQIDEINAKRIQIVTEKQENEDKPQTHKLTQIGNLATRYMDAKEYENYYKAMQMQIDATREQITQNEGQIAEWENMLTQFQEGGDDWIEIRDKIWAMREENASLENQALEDVIAMNQQKISQISEELERSQSFDNHAINMWSTYGGMYESNGQHADYRNTLSQQNTYYQTNISSYQTAIGQLQSLLATLDKTSDEWYSARDAIFQYEEAIAQAKNAILENNKAIQESTVSELTTNYDRMTSDLNHEVKMLQDQKQIYDDANDYEAYIEMMKKEKEATVDMVRSMKSSLATMESTIGTIDEDSDAWWNLHDKILSVREAISSSEVSLANFDRQIEQSKIDHLVEKFGQIDDMDQHNLKMIQYEETRYQNAGELTNYGTMLGIENEYQQRYADDLTDHIKLLKAERDNVETGSDAYYKLEQTIAKYEEQLEATNNTIEKNNKLLEQNKEKIRQTVMAVENIVDKEYRARIQKTRDMLAAEVNMQNTILDTIKKRYNDEFELEKRRINQLKENLNREKSLINERLNARKEAVDESNQYEELAEYKRQLALLAADPTRTKEYKEMQKRIQDMEESMSYDIAAKEVQSEGERIDDQLAAYDQYLTTAQEDLNMLLSDSQALIAAAQSDFGYNVAELMAGSWTDLLAWLQENNVNFRNATEELQTQMVQGWEDTWKKMWGIIDTYWDEISVIIGDQTSFMDYMKDSDTFAAASETGQKSLEYNWGETYEAMINAQKTGADYDHIHELANEFTSKIDEAKDWTYKVQLEGASKDLIGSFGLSDYLGYGLDHTPVDVSDIFWDDLYTGIGKVIEEYIGYSGGGGWGGEEEGSGGGSGKKTYDVYDSRGYKTSYTVQASSKEEAQKLVEKEYGSTYSATTHTDTPSGVGSSTSDTNTYTPAKTTTEKTKNTVSAAKNVAEQTNSTTKEVLQKTNEAAKSIVGVLSGIASLFGTKNAEGGLVDYTGLAWVDGSFSKPESFLDSVDTKHIAALTDALNYVSISSHPIVNPDTYSSHNTTVGDVNIVINQAELKSDEDVERLAKQVGKAFSRQLSKQGLNLNSISF